MSIIVVGTNHKYSPIALRERLHLSRKRIRDAASLLCERDTLRNAVILSTCNRVEIYAGTGKLKAGAGEIIDFISQFYEIDKKRLRRYLYVYEEEEAVRHLFSVACGLDSLVLGEKQIIGQIKGALALAGETCSVDGLLKEVFYAALSTAKIVHEKTGISEGKVSIGSVAIDFMKEKAGSLLGRKILIIGVGKVTELVLKYLKKEQVEAYFLANRTFEKAKALAAEIGAEAARFDELGRFLKRADIIITATASPRFIIKRETLESGIGRRLLIIDLAVPRDVDPKVKGLKKIELFGLEDLTSVIQKNLERKKGEAAEAGRIIDIEAAKLWRRVAGWEREPALLP